MISEPVRSESTTKPTPPNAWWIVFGVAAIFLGIGIYGLFRQNPTPLQLVQAQYLSDISRLESSARQLQRSITSKKSVLDIQSTFRQTRLAYKRVEFLAELYNPETAKSINGPNIPEADETDKRIDQPEGLQVLEELLFPYDPAQHDETVKQVSILVSNVGRLAKVAANNEMTDSHVFDAIRLEVFRVVSLGITGFDSPIIHHSLPESAEVLRSLQRHITFYQLGSTSPDLFKKLDETFTRSIQTLEQAPDFNRFDRLTFIAQQANVLSCLLLDSQSTLGVPVFNESRFLSSSARTLNDVDAFDASFYTKNTDDRPTSGRVALGKLLFYDPILSGDAKRTCATCHQPDRAFTDGETTSLAVGVNGKRVSRNAPTLLNASLQAAQFMDSRVAYLEDQANDVISNEVEMHGSLPKAVQALQQQPTYRKLFDEAYSEGVTEHSIKNALASYVRSLTSLDSRFDQYLRGKSVMLSDEEKLGFNLFMGKGQCATCHFFPLFNGTVPPAFAKSESEILGTPSALNNQRLDTDSGKFKTTGMELHRHAFKTPTIRNVALTAPYMHNGVYKTLDQVVDFYDRGGGIRLGFSVPNQTLPDTKLNLTKAEQQALVTFMKAL